MILYSIDKTIFLLIKKFLFFKNKCLILFIDFYNNLNLREINL